MAAAIQRCQVHKGRNIIERLPQHLHASVKKALRQAWDQDDANKAERLLRNLARRLEHEEPGVSGSILEGLEEILTVIRLGLPHELRRSLACTNIVENALGTVRQVTRNVKRWRHAEMALRWTAAGLLEAQKTFRRLKAYRPESSARGGDVSLGSEVRITRQSPIVQLGTARRRGAIEDCPLFFCSRCQGQALICSRCGQQQPYCRAGRSGRATISGMSDIFPFTHCQ